MWTDAVCEVKKQQEIMKIMNIADLETLSFSLSLNSSRSEEHSSFYAPSNENIFMLELTPQWTPNVVPTRIICYSDHTKTSRCLASSLNETESYEIYQINSNTRHREFFCPSKPV